MAAVTPVQHQDGPPTLRAVVIDDYYARPASGELRRYADTLRQFITDNVESGIKEWFEIEFGVSGDHRQADYFDSLLANQERVRGFWKKRDESPVGARLSKEVFNDLVDELYPAHESLKNIEATLAKGGWELRPLPGIPGRVEELADDLSLIVIDYILVPGDPVTGLRRSTDFLKSYLQHARSNPKFACPFVLLISENPDAEVNASAFRATIELHGSYFQFAKKANLSEEEFGQIIERFQGQRVELESYRKLHDQLQLTAKTSADKLMKSIQGLELQDLATLHAGQLVQEGEPLSDYLAWLFGQYLTAELVQDEKLANQAASLSTQSYKVLLGHLKPTQELPKLFANLSLAMPASAIKYREKNEKLQLRFGDMFVYEPTLPASGRDSSPQQNLPAAMTYDPGVEATSKVDAIDLQASKVPIAEGPSGAKVLGETVRSSARYLMVISQTCDLYHGNITNGQVLCIDGEGHLINGTEVDLLRATIRQMDQQGTILLQNGDKYVEVDWLPKNLRTVDETKLNGATAYRYLGRLNEMYALQAQHSALQEVGRIGVPVAPGHSVFFGKATLKLMNGQKEIAGVGAAWDRSMVIAVLRNEKGHTPVGERPRKSKPRLLVSEDFRLWLVRELAILAGNGNVNVQLKPHVDQFCAELEQRRNWTLVVKVQKDNCASFEQEGLSAKDAVIPPEPESLSKLIAIVLTGVFDVAARNNQHIQIAFERI